MASVVLITGAATGIGNLTARALAAAGHTVYASMRDVEGRNAGHAGELRALGRRAGQDLRVVELDVQSEASADAAVATILADAGRLDAVVHNAGHLYVGYVEAFTPEDIQRLLDINALGIQRVNRAVLPHMRERRSGTLVYVGSTTTVVVPPFLGPYVASKFAADALAQVTAYEVGQFGVETTIVMPGPFTQGTEHFPNASHAGDEDRSRAYAALDPLVARNEQATEALFPPGVDAHPRAVAEEIARVLALPAGTRPFRTVVDFSDAGVEAVNEVQRRAQEAFVTRLGFGELLHVKTDIPAPIRAFIDATNRGDSEAFAAAFTADAYLNDWGREYRGRDGVRAWDRTDNIGVQAHFELVAIEPGPDPDSHVATLTVTGNGHNGTGPLTFHLRDGLIASLRIS